MESGSLLVEALQHHDYDGNNIDYDDRDALQNTVVVTVCLLSLPHRTKPRNRKGSNVSEQREIGADFDTTTPQYLLALARMGVELNTFIQKSPYRWMTGGDGPVFGVHALPAHAYSTLPDTNTRHGRETKSGDFVPCLQCVYPYGVSVADEFHLIALVLEFSSNHPSAAVECWDRDDGSIALIETADHLPDWVDQQIRPQDSRFACWFCRGQVCLVTRSNNASTAMNSLNDGDGGVSLRQALTVLRCLSHSTTEENPFPCDATVSNQSLTTTTDARVHVMSTITHALRACLHKRHMCVTSPPDPALKEVRPSFSPPYHRAAVALPRVIWHLFGQRSDLIATACAAFCDQVLHEERVYRYNNRTTKESVRKNGKREARSKSKQESEDINGVDSSRAAPRPLAGRCEDWAWGVLELPRTQYAMLRTVVSAGSWESETSIPNKFLSVEVKRLRRQSAAEVTPYLRHGLYVGIRLVAGLDALLTLPARHVHNVAEEIMSVFASVGEYRILKGWKSIARLSGSDDGSWLQKAWEDGPNVSQHSLEDMLRCPAFAETTSHITPLSYPDVSLSAQLLQRLNKGTKTNKESASASFAIGMPGMTIPSAEDVDSESWMEMPTEEEMRKETAPVEVIPPSHSRRLSSNEGLNEEPDNLDGMLESMNNFIAGKSELVEGVASASRASASGSVTPQNENVHDRADVKSPEINPTVFLNMLHSILKAEHLDDLSLVLNENSAADAMKYQEPKNRYFFEDESDGDDESSQGESSTAAGDEEMLTTMQAMDEELKASVNISRSSCVEDMNSDIDSSGDPNDHAKRLLEDRDDATDDDDDVNQNIQIVSGILRSLDAGGGAPGPARNMLHEMGLPVL